MLVLILSALICGERFNVVWDHDNPEEVKEFPLYDEEIRIAAAPGPTKAVTVDLSPGVYSLSVSAVGHNGMESEKSDVFQLTVPSPTPRATGTPTRIAVPQPPKEMKVKEMKVITTYGE